MNPLGKWMIPALLGVVAAGCQADALPIELPAPAVLEIVAGGVGGQGALPGVGAAARVSAGKPWLLEDDDHAVFGVLFRVTISTGTVERVKSASTFCDQTVRAFDGGLWCANYTRHTLSRFAVSSPTETFDVVIANVPVSGFSTFAALADGSLYHANFISLARIDLAAGTSTHVSDLKMPIFGDAAGRLYGHTAGTIWRIDPATGEPASVLAADPDGGNGSSPAFSNIMPVPSTATDAIYVLGGSNLMRIRLADGNVTRSLTTGLPVAVVGDVVWQLDAMGAALWTAPFAGGARASSRARQSKPSCAKGSGKRLASRSRRTFS